MAGRPSTRARKSTAAAKPAPKPEPEEVEEELEELADDEEFEELEEAPAQTAPAGKKSRSADTVTFGVAHLAEHLSTKFNKVVTTRELRTLIRRMARDGKGRVDREIVAGNRSRYDWPLGLKDPEVKAIIAAYEGGEAQEAKTEALTALKEKNAAARAAKKSAAPAAKPNAKKAAAKKPAPPVEEDDDEELEFDDDDE